jgi:signal transduction histidine kinase
MPGKGSMKTGRDEKCLRGVWAWRPCARRSAWPFEQTAPLSPPGAARRILSSINSSRVDNAKVYEIRRMYSSVAVYSIFSKESTLVNFDQPRDEALLKQMLLLALAHDFMSPFRALAFLLDEMSSVLDDSGSAKWMAVSHEAEAFSRHIDEEVLPNLAGLYNEVESRRTQSLDEVLSFLNRSAGPRIDHTVREGRRLYSMLTGFAGGAGWNARIRELDLILKKSKNMLTMLGSMRSTVPSQSAIALANLEDAAAKAAEVATRAGASLISKVEGSATVNANAGQMWILFANLISNAVKYAYHGNPARVDIYISKCRLERLQEIAANIRRRAEVDHAPGGEHYREFEQRVLQIRGWAQILVQDQGIGIPAKRIWGIFKVGKQLAPYDYASEELARRSVVARNSNASSDSHYGFGLALCQFFVRLHSGEIVVDSREGGPTTFGIWLPIGKGQVKRSAPYIGRRLWWESRI